MLTDERRMELSDVLRPISPPVEVSDVYTDDQRERLLDVVRTQGPWKLIIAQHFASADELMATMSGAFPEGITPSLDLFLTPTFRGYLANYGTVLYPELHDVFYNEDFLKMAKSYWHAEYAKPELMLFNINGPCAESRSGTPGFAEFPRRAPRERTDLAVQRDGQVRAVLRLSDQDGPGNHLVLPRRGQRLHLLAAGPTAAAAAAVAPGLQPWRSGPERDDGAPR